MESAEESQLVEDLRGAPRRRTFKAARIVYNGGHSVLNCTVRDLSDSGACLMIDTFTELPESFAVYFQDGRKVPVEVIWKRNDRMGVRFVKDASVDRENSGKIALLKQIGEIEQALENLKKDIRIHFGDY